MGAIPAGLQTMSVSSLSGGIHMRQCSFCHEAIPEDSDFCPFCGKRQEEKVTCPYCGMKNRAGSHFCSRCGYAFKVNPEGASTRPGNETNKKWLAVILAAALLVFGGALTYFLTTEPAGNAEPVTADSVSSEPVTHEEAKLNTAESTPEKQVEELIKKRGYSGYHVLAVSDMDDLGFLALVTPDSDTQQFIAYDKPDGALALVDRDRSDMLVREFGVKRAYGYEPLIFPVTVRNDIRNEDAALGEWDGADHSFMIYYLYTLDNNGNVKVDGNTSSATGSVEASHYQTCLKSRRTVNIANTIVMHLPGLKRHMDEKGVEFWAR